MTRVVEVTVRDSCRPRTVLRLASDLTRDGRAWGRWEAWANGARVGKRRIGRRRIAELLAGLLE